MTMNAKNLFTWLMLSRIQESESGVAEQILEKISMALRNATASTLPKNTHYIQAVLESVLENLIQQLYASDDTAFNSFKSKYAKKDPTLKEEVLFKSLADMLAILLNILSDSVLKYMHLLNQEEINHFETEKLVTISRSIANYLFKDYQLSNTFNLRAENIKHLIRMQIYDEKFNEPLFKVAGSHDDPKGEALARLLLLGADPDARTKGVIPLQKATLYNNYAHVEILLSQGAMPNRKTIAGSWSGWGAAHTAAYICSPAMIEILLKYQVNFALPLDVRSKFDGHTPVTILLTLPQSKAKQWKTGKIYRCFAKFYRVLSQEQFKVILNTPVNPRARQPFSFSSDWRGWLPLCIAVYNWKRKFNPKKLLNIIDLLLDAGADPNLLMEGSQNAWRGFNALHVLAYNKSNLSTTFRLAAYRALMHSGGNIHTLTSANARGGYALKTVFNIENLRNEDNSLVAKLESDSEKNS